MTSENKQRPRAFRLDDARLDKGCVVIEQQPDTFAMDGVIAPEEAAIEAAQKRGVLARRGFSWGLLFWSSLGALIALSFGAWVGGLIESFFAHSAALGWLGLGLTLCLFLSLAAFVWREVAGLMRQREIAALHIAFAEARAADDRSAARKLVEELSSLYKTRPDTARARANLADLSRDIIDGRDLIDIAEREFMAQLDEQAIREIARAAKRVSFITAISPRAMVDVIVVAAQALRLIRRMAEIYGGRPGTVGMLRLARSVGGHLALTGGMAAAETGVQQLLGDGLVGMVSTKAAEGLANGMLTTRVGLSAMAVCRPMPFAARKAPGVRDVAPFLFGGKKDGAQVSQP